MKADLRADIAALRLANPIPGVAASVTKLVRTNDEWLGCCPFHPDRTPSFTVFAAGLRFHCFGCGASGDVIDFVRRLHGIGLREAIDQLSAGSSLPAIQRAPEPVRDRSKGIREARALWAAAEPAVGTLAETYLRSRGLHLAIPEAIRFARLRYGKAGALHPVLIAAVASADDHVTGVQRIYLSPCGTAKARVPKAKLSLGRVAGGAIRLAPAARHLMLTEGLEDGLTLQQELGRAVWVSCGATLLSSVLFPAGVEEVAVGGDNDPVGQAAAHQAVRTFRERGVKARAFFPVGAKDFNAELMEGLGL